MNNKEEQNMLKEEAEALNGKFAELSAEELEQVSGGKAEVFNEIREILASRLGIAAGTIGTQSGIVDELGADSLDVVDVVKSAELQFNIKINQAGIGGIQTVADLCNLVNNSLS